MSAGTVFAGWAAKIANTMFQLFEVEHPSLLTGYGVSGANGAELIVFDGGKAERIRNETAVASHCGVAPFFGILRTNDPAPA